MIALNEPLLLSRISAVCMLLLLDSAMFDPKLAFTMSAAGGVIADITMLSFVALQV